MQSGCEDTLEERYAIKFCFKLGKNAATEMYGMLQTAFGASCMNQASVFEWDKRFKEDSRRLLQSGLEFHACTINKSAHTKKVWKLIQ